jgi:hypothetical protein
LPGRTEKNTETSVEIAVFLAGIWTRNLPDIRQESYQLDRSVLSAIKTWYLGTTLNCNVAKWLN